jgi:hypothetical protein
MYNASVSCRPFSLHPKRLSYGGASAPHFQTILFKLPGLELKQKAPLR